MIGLTYILFLENTNSKELAQKLGVTPATVLQWESKTRPIPAKRMEQITQLYPTYKQELICCDVGEREKLLIQNACILAKLKSYRDSEDPKTYIIRQNLKKKEAHNNFNLKKLKVLQAFSELIEMAYKYGSEEGDILLQSMLLEDLERMYSIERQYIMDKINHNGTNYETLQDIDDLLSEFNYRFNRLDDEKS